MKTIDEALQIASENGNLEAVKFLISIGADVHARTDSSLRAASENGHIEIVKLLVESGADIHANNNDALYWAIFNNHTQIVNLLFEQMLGGKPIELEYTEIIKILENKLKLNDPWLPNRLISPPESDEIS